MVVASTTRKSGPYNFNGVTTEWPITFEVNGITEDEVLVYQVLGGISILIESNYTVDLENLEVVYPSVVSGLPPFEAEDGQILIVRELSILQGTDFKDQGAFRAEDIEDQLDRWAMIAQQLQEQLDRTAQSDISDNTSDPEIGALLQEISDAKDEATVAAASAETYADNAAASASTALVYASSAQTSASQASTYADNAAASASQAAAYLSTYKPTVQTVYSQDGAVATGTTILPVDDTIPQNNEGDQYLSASITPTSATNILAIEVVVVVAHSAGTGLAAALFQDSTADSLAASTNFSSAAGSPTTITFRHHMLAGTTSSTTFKVRAGAGTAGTTTFNGFSGGRVFGGLMASSITIKEIKA